MASSDTRKRLLDAAQDLVQRVGANAMSYQHLADAVGIRKASVHHYFPAKSDLLVALIDRYRAHFLNLLDQIEQREEKAAARLARYCRLFEATLQEAACDKACPCGMLGAEVATLEPKAAASLRRFYDENRRKVAEILEAGRKDGSLRFPGESEVVAWSLFAFLEGAMLVARVDGGVKRFREAVATYLEMLRK
jgi:TetR/AcrR family transcriptional repressor of nem operon